MLGQTESREDLSVGDGRLAKDTTASAPVADTCFSFDVFDTAICRLVHSPEHVHLMVGRILRQRGVTRCTDTAWLRARVDAETRCRRTTEQSEITIAEIYRRLSQALDLSEGDAQIALRTEFEPECRLTRPIAHTRNRVFDLVGSREKVLFLSDTYFSSKDIETLLSRNGYDFSLDVVASSDELRSKAAGDVYGHIAGQRGLAGARFHHLGDNFAADYTNARVAGWHAEHFTRSYPTRRERAIFASGADDFLTSAIAGSVRAARLAGDRDVEDGVLAAASSVLGPLLTGYILWILLDIQARGGGMVHFLSDDHGLLASMCRRLADWLEIDIDVRDAGDPAVSDSRLYLVDLCGQGMARDMSRNIAAGGMKTVKYVLSSWGAVLSSDHETRAWSDLDFNNALIGRLIDVCGKRGHHGAIMQFVTYLTQAADPGLYPPAETCAALARTARAAYRYFLWCPTRAEAAAFAGDGDRLDWRMGAIARSQHKPAVTVTAMTCRAVDIVIRFKTWRTRRAMRTG